MTFIAAFEIILIVSVVILLPVAVLVVSKRQP